MAFVSKNVILFMVIDSINNLIERELSPTKTYVKSLAGKWRIKRGLYTFTHDWKTMSSSNRR